MKKQTQKEVEKEVLSLIKDLKYGYVCFNALFNNDKEARKELHKKIEKLFKLSYSDYVSTNNRGYIQKVAHEYNMALLDTMK
jgi:hypothetical protein